MKKIYLLSFIFCCFFATTMGNALNRSNDADEIDLLGDLVFPKQKSLIKPIEAFITGQYIEVNLYANLGTIAIFIYDETGGIVYQQSVITSSEQQVIINISSFDSGEYEIEFVNSQNQYLSGVFEI
ncbi:MAG: DUF3244 domain-containing protein [Candidatus Symbiothrix sp.]|jgi:hypothetical protein|nr:DUF3244 domain-containing protein [Candidatus Symbiothrix sp.]